MGAAYKEIEVNLMTASWECITFVITDGEVGLPSSLLCEAEEESVSSEWLVRVCGTHRLYPLKVRNVVSDSTFQQPYWRSVNSHQLWKTAIQPHTVNSWEVFNRHFNTLFNWEPIMLPLCFMGVGNIINRSVTTLWGGTLSITDVAHRGQALRQWPLSRTALTASSQPPWIRLVQTDAWSVWDLGNFETRSMSWVVCHDILIAIHSYVIYETAHRGLIQSANVSCCAVCCHIDQHHL